MTPNSSPEDRAALADEILPCPFCGSREISSHDHYNEDATAYTQSLACGQCEAATGSRHADVEAAIAAWNRRALRAAPAVPREPVAWLLEFTIAGQKERELWFEEPRPLELENDDIVTPLYAAPGATHG